MWYPQWEKSLRVQFSFLSTADALHCICFIKNMQCDCIIFFDHAGHGAYGVNNLVKKSQRKSENVPFSLYGSQRGLGFHLESSEFLAYTDSNKYGYDILSVYMFFNISSFLLNRKVTFCQGKYMYMPSDILSQKRKKTISLHYFCTIKNNSMETRVYIDSIRLGIAPWQGVISSCILGLDIPDRVCIFTLKLRFIQCSSFKVIIHC